MRPGPKMDQWSKSARLFVCSCGKKISLDEKESHEKKGHAVISKEDDEILMAQERAAYDAGDLEI